MTPNRAVAVYACDRGEDFSGFDIYGLPHGDPMTADVTVECQLKVATQGISVPAASDPSVLAMTLTFVAATDGDPARYVATISAAQSAQLRATTYITTPKMTLADGTIKISAPVAIRVQETTS